ncbi:MAG: DTW domain-containing protein [Gammaproteobacteria bacterium]|nr:DTW domain-containing protein [Gammaproteobacteria bacterium]
MTEALPCPACGKPAGLCICDRVEPVDTRLRVIILQHPREQDEVLGTARLVALTLPGAEIRIGLSWPSLDAAIGETGADRSRWAVLAVAKPPAELPEEARGANVVVMERTGRLRDLRRPGLAGIILLDGTWSQAKTLWWRNPWLLRLPRVLLNPREPSLYGRLRQEPRKGWVSTLEAVADVLPALGEPEVVRDNLRRLLRTLLQRARDRSKSVTA